MRKQDSPRHYHVIIFSRYPVPGKTKTRLIPALGTFGAADLHREMTEKMVTVARKAACGKSMTVEACLDAGSENQMVRWLGPGLTFSNQVQGDLGERMRAAIAAAFQKGAARVVVTGTDIPGANERHIQEAFEALGSHDLVLGPTGDGGYWLLGLNSPEDLFHGVAWGSGRVLDQTVVAAREKGLALHMLETLEDLDREEQLGLLMPAWSEKRPSISVIIPTLNEANHVKRVVQSAGGDRVECIVVDGGSEDNTVPVAEETGARISTSPPGRAKQQNRGAEIARGRVLLFLHADTMLPRDYVQQVFETLLDKRVVLGAFRFKTDLDQPMMKGIEALTNFRSRFLGLPYGDQGLFLRQERFNQIGGFPEVPLAEDLLLVRKLGRLGRIGMAPGHVVTSARRWKEVGFLRTTILNQIIAAGCLLGVPPERLRPFFRKRR